MIPIKVPSVYISGECDVDLLADREAKPRRSSGHLPPPGPSRSTRFDNWRQPVSSHAGVEEEVDVGLDWTNREDRVRESTHGWHWD